MLVKNFGVLCKAAKPFFVPKRNWAQMGMLVCTPPRVKVSWGEQLGHCLFMIAFWTTPMAYGLSQIKVWRRTYIGP